MSGKDDDFAVSMIFSDPSPNGHINQRVSNAFCLNLDKVDLSQAEQEILIDRLISLCKKLAITWKHLDRYRRVEDDLIAKAIESPLRVEGNRVGFNYSDDLYAEFDSFLVQFKSSLDYLAHVPGPVFGSGWNPRTFGNKGEKIIKLLGSIGKRYPERIALVIDIVRSNQSWLADVIDVRDRSNHFQRGGVSYEYFQVKKVVRNGHEAILVPMWNEAESVRDVLGHAWRKLLCFCEAFIGFTLYLRLKPYWGVQYRHIEDEGETEASEDALDSRWRFELDLNAITKT